MSLFFSGTPWYLTVRPSHQLVLLDRIKDLEKMIESRDAWITMLLAERSELHVQIMRHYKEHP